ncbi:hypothetical protein [Nocardioides sp.]|uniref:divisome protein SepX/GlpR n=1 Tax=Nocardioides sp. TaxID=35761 RepID=UPI00261FD128|nr:hypothetical protein [Nocardioides sp.]
MDLSALIFVALAVAWAVYLIPKALKQHEDSAASRSIDGFSDRLRVLARREPVDSTTARLVVNGAKTAESADDSAVSVSVSVEKTSVAPAEPAARWTPGQVRARRAAAARAAQRRLRVVCTILLGIAVVGALAALGYVRPAFTFIPVGLLVAWLVACRLMVRSERASDDLVRRPAAPLSGDAAEADDEDPLTEEIAVVHVEADLVVPTGAGAVAAEPEPSSSEAPSKRPGDWDPVPVTLPTYVAKEPAAKRTVRTIDLDSTGVWTSGPLASDSELAREADEAERSAKTRAAEAERRRASGS